MDENMLVRLVADGIPLAILCVMAFLYFKKKKN